MILHGDGTVLLEGFGRYTDVVFNGWEWVVEGVQKALPLGILGGLAKSLGMVFQRTSADEKQILIFNLYTTQQFVGDITSRGGNDALRLLEGGLERGVVTGPDIEHCNLENHGAPQITVWRFRL